MARVTHHRQLNTAGLEADVMRFMAIIAFCLIAMMALVKDVEGPAEQVTVTKAIVQKEPVSEVDTSKVAISEVNDVKPPVSRSATTKTPRVAAPVFEPVPEPNADKAVAKVQATPMVVKKQTPQDPEPLTFRFESDKTFLHLIATDRLQLYAHTAEGFLVMDDRFNIIESRPSGELFEVMAQSIPRKIKSIFNRINISPVYLVALPAETRRDLNKFLGTDGKNSATGVLIIHRNGRISHEI
jgi:hypothetical protein